MKYIATSPTEYTLPPRIHEISDINSMLKSLLHNETKVNISIDDIRLKSNLTTKKTIRFTKKYSFIQDHVLFKTILDFGVILKDLFN